MARRRAFRALGGSRAMTAEARRKWKAGLPRASPWVLGTRTGSLVDGADTAPFELGCLQLRGDDDYGAPGLHRGSQPVM
jgi:hypothetical protein